MKELTWAVSYFRLGIPVWVAYCTSRLGHRDWCVAYSLERLFVLACLFVCLFDCL